MKKQNTSESIVKWIGLLVIRDKKVLMLREKNKDFFVLPGGRVEKDESELSTLTRELMEELGVKPVNYKFHRTHKVLGRAENKMMIFKLYIGEIEGDIILGEEPVSE